MLTDRDKRILKYLRHFRVLSRDQLGAIICPETSRPWATINRIMKRLDRDGHIITIPRPKDECYLYMPNPAIIQTESTKIRHFLSIADFYIRIGQPEIYEVEPHVSDEYRPDAYARVPEPVIIEIQRTHTSNRKMQEKINGFVDAFYRGAHDAKTLWIVSDENYKVNVPDGFQVVKVPLKEGVL